MKIKTRRRPTLLFKHLCFGLLSAIFVSCASSKHKIIDASTLAPNDIQRRVAGHLSNFRSFQGKARVIIELPGQGYNGFSNVYINLPDSIFVKTEAILGIDIGALFLDHQNFGAYAPRDNVLYYGEVAKLSLKDFLQVELETRELYEVFTGQVQVIVDSTSTVAVVNDNLHVTTVVGDDTLKYWVDPRRYVVNESKLISARGEVLLHKKFERFKNKNGIELPKIIRLTRPAARERITVYYTQQEVNKPIPLTDFRLKVPDNARKVYWGDLEKPTIDRTPQNKQKSN